MPGDFMFFILLGVLVCSLIAAMILNQRHQQIQQTRKRIIALRKQADTLKDTALALAPYIDKPEPIIQLLNLANKVLEQLKPLAPQASFPQASQEANKSLINQIQAAIAEREPVESLSSTRALDRLNEDIERAIGLVNTFVKQGLINGESGKKSIDILSWCATRIEAGSHLQAGDQKSTEGDVYQAQTYYKHALSILKKTTLGGEKRNEWIKEIRQKIEQLGKTSADR